MNKHNTKYVGIDLGDKTSLIQVRNGAGEFEKEMRIPTTTKAMEREFGRREPMRIAIEVGGHSRWVSKMLRSCGHEVVVANASKLRLIYENPRKSDRVDAEYLAKLLRLDASLLSPVMHREEETQQHLAILRSRDSLVQTRTQLVNHVRGMVKSFGSRLPSCSTKSFARKARPELPESLRPALEPILESIQDMSEHIQKYDREIEHLCQQVYPETANMRQIKGVGALTSLAYVLTLEDARRFHKSRDVGPYLGLVPRRNQSGDADPEGRITKTGDKYLRCLLVGCAQYILGPFGEESHLRTWGLGMAESGGKRAKKRAVVAVARKLAVLLHKLWVSGQDYDPFYPAKSTQSLA
ncbi:MAG: IS110 family transposase [Candidatus Deferrimicrobiaceae bacterium]|jgi:transposase